MKELKAKFEGKEADSIRDKMKLMKIDLTNGKVDQISYN